MNDLPRFLMYFLIANTAICFTGLIVTSANVLGVFGSSALAVIALLLISGLAYIAHAMQD